MEAYNLAISLCSRSSSSSSSSGPPIACCTYCFAYTSARPSFDFSALTSTSFLNGFSLGSTLRSTSSHCSFTIRFFFFFFTQPQQQKTTIAHTRCYNQHHFIISKKKKIKNKYYALLLDRYTRIKYIIIFTVPWFILDIFYLYEVGKNRYDQMGNKRTQET